jgi:peptidoglycan/xylan/chitin deacetylase (PgdA/CDA1 family)
LVIERVHTDKPYVAITVDDFFSVSNYQDREGVHLLEAANAAHAALTLCPTGYALEAYQTLVPDQLAQIKTLLAEGQYEICTHTLSHPVLPKLDRQGQAHEIGAGGKHIEHYLERPVSRLLRPPFGSWNDDTRYAAAAAGYPYIVTWSVDSGDWVGKEPPAVDTILANVACAQPGDIILMHANCQRSAEVLPLIIERLRANGLEPVTLSTLLASGQPMTTTNPKALEHGRFCPKGGK